MQLDYEPNKPRQPFPFGPFLATWLGLMIWVAVIGALLAFTGAFDRKTSLILPLLAIAFVGTGLWSAFWAWLWGP